MGIEIPHRTEALILRSRNQENVDRILKLVNKYYRERHSSPTINDVALPGSLRIAALRSWATVAWLIATEVYCLLPGAPKWRQTMAHARSFICIPVLGLIFLRSRFKRIAELWICLCLSGCIIFILKTTEHMQTESLLHCERAWKALRFSFLSLDEVKKNFQRQKQYSQNSINNKHCNSSRWLCPIEAGALFDLSDCSKSSFIAIFFMSLL